MAVVSRHGIYSVITGKEVEEIIKANGWERSSSGWHIVIDDDKRIYGYYAGRESAVNLAQGLDKRAQILAAKAIDDLLKGE